MVTASTRGKLDLFSGSARLAVLHHGLITVAAEFGWQLEAWAVLSNHYHFVAHSPCAEPTAHGLSRMLAKLRGQTARWVNRIDGCQERQVWHNFWETRLTFPRSYLARLNYVHQNAVRHGLVAVAKDYPWCSARWFERTATPAQVKTIYAFPIDQLQVGDSFHPSQDW